MSDSAILPALMRMVQRKEKTAKLVFAAYLDSRSSSTERTVMAMRAVEYKALLLCSLKDMDCSRFEGIDVAAGGGHASQLHRRVAVLPALGLAGLVPLLKIESPTYLAGMSMM